MLLGFCGVGVVGVASMAPMEVVIATVLWYEPCSSYAS